MSEPLKEKYRPRSFEEFVGGANNNTIIGLKSVCRREKGPPPAILFVGPRGCGKTTLAGIVKNELKVSDTDFIELNTADDRGIDTIRNIKSACQYSPLAGKRKIYFLDEIHKVTNDGQNALLKLLEKPPSHVTFILATTDPQMLIETVRSRCTIYQVNLLINKEIEGLVKDVLKKEKVSIPQQAIQEIANLADGSPREALVILDAVIDIEDDNDLINAVMTYNLQSVTIKDLIQALLNNRSFEEISNIVKGLNDEPEKVRYAILGYMNTVLLSNGKSAPRAAQIINEFRESFMYSKKAGFSLACYLCTNK